jgi:hypothetical protein
MKNTFFGYDIKTVILICTMALIIIINALYNSQKKSLDLQEGMDTTDPNTTDPSPPDVISPTNIPNIPNTTDIISPTNIPNTTDIISPTDPTMMDTNTNTPIIPNTSIPSITAVAPPLTVDLNITQISPQKLRSKCISNCYASYPSTNE